MTKHRLSWSDWRRLAAACCCSLGLAPAAWALDSPALSSLDQDVIVGLASHYGYRLHGRRTATGERLDRSAFTAASNLFSLNSKVLVRRPSNDTCAVVRINDRMSRHHRARVIDVTSQVGRHLGMLQAGVVKVEVSAHLASRLPLGPLSCADALVSTSDQCADCDSSNNNDLADQSADVVYPSAQIPVFRPTTEISPR